jgi:hypothetical protein
MVLLACHRDATPTEWLEASLRHRLEKQSIVAHVVCPDVELAAGVAVTCTASGGGTTFPIDVTLRDDKGAYDWQIRGTVLDTRELGRDLAAQRRNWGVLGCDHPRVVLVKDATITCALFDGGQARHLAITATGDPGHPFRWRVVP